MKNSLRLSVLLVGLVGINVYVFFFNHKTAPRDVLNLQSTTKTMETSRREVLAADAREAREALTAEAATKATKKKAAESHREAAAAAPVAEAVLPTDKPSVPAPSEPAAQEVIEPAAGAAVAEPMPAAGSITS